MAKIERFEDIEGWKKARELSRAIYDASKSGAFSKDYALRDQIRSASISISSNIAEGFERGGDKEFRQFLSIAKGSAGEVRSQLYSALDAGYFTQAEFDALYALSLEVSRTISGLMNYLATSSYSGNKYRDVVRDEAVSSTLDLRPWTLDSPHG